MTFSPAQKAAILSNIAASPDLSSIPNTGDGAYVLADLYNAPAVPDFIVWKTYLHEQEITSLTSSEGTTWSWPAFISRSAAEQTGWARMFNGTYSVNPSLVQVRVGLADIFSGGTGAAQRAHLLAIAKEKATRIEKLFADVSGGAGILAAPATRTFVGKIQPDDISNMRAV